MQMKYIIIKNNEKDKSIKKMYQVHDSNSKLNVFEKELNLFNLDKVIKK